MPQYSAVLDPVRADTEVSTERSERSPGPGLFRQHRRWFALVLVCLSSLMIVLDSTIVNVALPAIQQDLGFSQAGLAWIFNAYLLTFGGFMLLAGRAADLFGRRKFLIAGFALFTLASVACGFATSQGVLVIARGIQGIGGSIISAVSLSLVLVLFPETRERAKAMSIWGFVGSGGGSVGVIAGGLLTQGLNWHWIFLINAPIGLVALRLARPLLPKDSAIRLAHSLDVGGTLAVISAPLLMVYGLVNAGQSDANPLVTLVCLAGALGIVVVFVVHESRVRTPLVRMAIFRSRTISVASVMTAFSGAAFFGWFFFSPLYAQQVLNYNSLQTGLTFLPATLVMGGLSLGITAWIVGRFGPKRPMVTGMAIFVVGLLLFARAPVDGSFWPDMLVPMLLLGLGAGISFMPLILVGTQGVSASDSGLVSGLLSTSQLIGGSIGLALLAGVASFRTAGLAADGADHLVALTAGYQAAFLVAACLELVTLTLATTLPRGSGGGLQRVGAAGSHARL
jgi:EmrB/QacA subfamily drug resistance transporter